MERTPDDRSSARAANIAAFNKASLFLNSSLALLTSLNQTYRSYKSYGSYRSFCNSVLNSYSANHFSSLQLHRPGRSWILPLGMTREILLFFILFSAGLMVAVFVGIIWITKVMERTALQMKQRIAERMASTIRSMQTHRTIALHS